AGKRLNPNRRGQARALRLHHVGAVGTGKTFGHLAAAGVSDTKKENPGGHTIQFTRVPSLTFAVAEPEKTARPQCFTKLRGYTRQVVSSILLKWFECYPQS